MRALVVDDSKTMRRIVGKVVKENGFDTVLEAEKYLMKPFTKEGLRDKLLLLGFDATT